MILLIWKQKLCDRWVSKNIYFSYKKVSSKENFFSWKKLISVVVLFYCTNLESSKNNVYERKMNNTSGNLDGV